jgi:O-antigen/teichoic acid export membrane protein
MSAGFWAASLQFVLRIFIVIRTVILARLLTPDDFGLMAIAVISIMLLDRFTQSGFESALVQKDADIRPYLDTAWTMQILRGVVMAGLLAAGAPLIAGFFGAEEAESVVRVLAIAVLIKGFQNVAVVFFVKELRFDRYFRLEVSEKGTDIVVSITAAILLRNVWALVFGVLAGSVMKMVTSYVIHPYRPRPGWVWDQVKELFGFGKWILAHNTVGYLAGELDDILVGRMLGVERLGLYRMAYNFSQAVATEIAQVMNQVAFPAYSQLQDSIERLRRAYYGSLHLVGFIGFPLAVGTILVAPDLTVGVLGSKWEPMIAALQLLSIAGLARGLGATTGPLFQSQGRPDLPPRFSFAKLILMAILLYPAIDAWGMNGAAIVVVIAGTLTSLAAVWVALRFIGGFRSQLSQTMGYPALNTAVMALAVLAARWIPIDRPSALSFVLLAGIGVVAYLVCVVLTVRVGGYRSPMELLAKIREAAG